MATGMQAAQAVDPPHHRAALPAPVFTLNQKVGTAAAFEVGRSCIAAWGRRVSAPGAPLCIVPGNLHRRGRSFRSPRGKQVGDGAAAAADAL